MLAIMGAVLVELQLFLHIPPVFLGGIVLPLTLGTL
jgi:hypothetical protein